MNINNMEILKLSVINKYEVMWGSYHKANQSKLNLLNNILNSYNKLSE